MTSEYTVESLPKTISSAESINIVKEGSEGTISFGFLVISSVILVYVELDELMFVICVYTPGLREGEKK